MESEQEREITTEPEAPVAPTPTPAPKTTVTVTAKEDCTVLVDGKSVTLAEGDTAEMTPEEAASYANLGLVSAGETPLSGSQGSFGTERGVPKRR